VIVVVGELAIWQAQGAGKRPGAAGRRPLTLEMSWRELRGCPFVMVPDLARGKTPGPSCGQAVAPGRLTGPAAGDAGSDAGWPPVAGKRPYRCVTGPEARGMIQLTKVKPVWLFFGLATCNVTGLAPTARMSSRTSRGPMIPGVPAVPAQQACRCRCW